MGGGHRRGPHQDRCRSHCFREPPEPPEPREPPEPPEPPEPREPCEPREPSDDSPSLSPIRMYAVVAMAYTNKPVMSGETAEPVAATDSGSSTSSCVMKRG